MEIIQIKSEHSLIASTVASRPIEAHSYTLNCRQYVSAYQDWQKTSRTPEQGCDIMTLDYVRIRITDIEGKQIQDAILAAQSPVMVD